MTWPVLVTITPEVLQVALHGIHHDVVVALAIAQVRSGHDLHLVEPGFLEEEC
jgi:hypothetical protein